MCRLDTCWICCQPYIFIILLVWWHHIISSTASPNYNLRKRSLVRRSENIWECVHGLETLDELLLPSVSLWELKFIFEPVTPENTDSCFHPKLLLSMVVRFCFNGESYIRWYSVTLWRGRFPLSHADYICRLIFGLLNGRLNTYTLQLSHNQSTNLVADSDGNWDIPRVQIVINKLLFLSNQQPKTQRCTVYIEDWENK